MRGEALALAVAGALLFGGFAAHPSQPQASVGTEAAAARGPPADALAPAFPLAGSQRDAYVEWWYFEASELPGDPADPTPGVLENYFAAVIVVNPLDVEGHEGAATGIYLMVGSMVGPDRQFVMQRIPDVSAFTSASAGRADIAVTSGGVVLASIRTDPLDDNRVDVRVSVDLASPGLVTSQRLDGVDPAARELPQNMAGLAPRDFSAFSMVTFELHFDRTLGFAPRAQAPDALARQNPGLNWVVYALDGDLRASQPSSLVWRARDGSAETSVLRPGYFRAYADKNWGTSYPTNWVWGMGKWKDDPATPSYDESQIVFAVGAGCVAAASQCLGGLPGGPGGAGAGALDLWSGPFFLQYRGNAAQDSSLHTLLAFAGDPAYKTTIQPLGPSDTYDDRDGWWQIPRGWRVTAEPRDACKSPGSDGRLRAEVVVTPGEDRSFDLPFAAPRAEIRGTGAAQAGRADAPAGPADPFHDFEALEARAELTVWTCAGGRFVLATAPDGTYGWPIVATTAGWEWGALEGRAAAAELFASAVSGSSEAGTHTVSASAVNIGGAPAFDPKLQIERAVCAGGTCGWASAFDSSRAPGYVDELKGGQAQDGSAHLGGAATYSSESGEAIGLGAAEALPAVVQDGAAAPSGWPVELKAAIAASRCDAFRVVASTTSEQLDTSNDVRFSNYCPYAGRFEMREEIVASQRTGAQGNSDGGVTFADGSTTRDVEAGGGSLLELPLVAAVTQAELAGRALSGFGATVRFERPDTGFAVSASFAFPVTYSADSEPSYAASPWQAAWGAGERGGPGLLPAGGPPGYAPDQSSYLRMRIDLSHAHAAEVSFGAWMDVEGARDALSFSVLQADGTRDQLLSLSPNASAGDANAARWIRAVVDLTPFVGAPREVELRFESDAAVSGAGVRVDAWHVLEQLEGAHAWTVSWDGVGPRSAEARAGPVDSNATCTLTDAAARCSANVDGRVPFIQAPMGAVGVEAAFNRSG